MRAYLEFALFSWVGISVAAVLVQLVRIARYKLAMRKTVAAGEAAPEAPTLNLPDAPSIDLSKQADSEADGKQADTEADGKQADTEADGKQADTEADVESPLTRVMATASAVASAAETQPAAAAASHVPAAQATAVQPSPANVVAAATAPAATATETAQSAPTLADVLAGVRLPWNLLPTVDQSREPSNSRVVLITSEGEPGDIGVDVADELERLGFTIAPRGDDAAVATRDRHTLGLQIIPEPMAATVDGVRRFPTATDSSVAIDIWLE